MCCRRFGGNTIDLKSIARKSILQGPGIHVRKGGGNLIFAPIEQMINNLLGRDFNAGHVFGKGVQPPHLHADSLRVAVAIFLQTNIYQITVHAMFIFLLYLSKNLNPPA